MRGSTTAQQGARALAMALTLFTVGVGCSVEPEPLEPAAVVWPDGEPTGVLESDPWVQAVREYHLLTATAWNAHDWSDPALLAVMSGNIVADFTSAQRDAFDQGQYHVFAGPAPLVPLSVEMTGEDSATVEACGYASWTISPGQSGAEFDGVTKTFYELERNEEGGIRVMRPIGDFDAVCDPAAIKPGLFDPAPVPFEGLDADDVREAEPKRR